MPVRSHVATLFVWFQLAVQRSLRFGSGAFGTSGLRRSFRPGLNASSAAIQAMFGPLGAGVSELRIKYGPGYRVYFQRRGSMLVILLAGGDKSTQANDIRTAQDLARNLKEDE